MFQMPDWAGVFVPDQSLIESFARASVVYLSLLVLFRVVMNRQTGSIGLPDVMLVVLVSECVSQSLSADAKSVPNGLAAVGALLFWSYALDRLSCRWPWLQRRLEPRPVEVVKDGKPVRENMDSEGLSDDELEAQLRLNGIDDVSKVKSARIESEGTVSVVPKEKEDGQPAPPAAEKPPDFEAAVRAFADAADRLKDAIAWHDERAAGHAAAAKSARAELARHGIRVPRAGKAAPSD
ncbi:MAG TPA: YetF domain-containing protein [Gemmataceae bacterium]|nr:YetF domain-containing protein [Gemmataceae bacterium]